MHRVVVTGMGVITPIGADIPSFAANLRAGTVGARQITSFDASPFPFKIACEAEAFDARKHGTHLMDPFIQYAVAAAEEAITMAQLDISKLDPYTVGISVSSSKGGVHTIDRFKERFEKHPSAILGARIYANSVPNFAAQWIARKWEIKGPAKNYVAACATGTVAVIEGARMVEDGIVDYCIAGASDASITPLMLAGYRSMKVLAKEQMRPFDQRRDGFLVGEGAGIVILEREANALARGAKIFGTLSGSAYGSDGHHTLHYHEPEHALERTIKLLFSRHGLAPRDIDGINLHGTATRHGDLYEMREVKRALGKRAYEIPMSATKSMTGHMLGASGTVEIIASLIAMNGGFVPPTAGLGKPESEFDVDLVPQKAKNHSARMTLSLSMGFGGHIAVIAIGKGE